MNTIRKYTVNDTAKIFMLEMMQTLVQPPPRAVDADDRNAVAAINVFQRVRDRHHALSEKRKQLDEMKSKKASLEVAVAALMRRHELKRRRELQLEIDELHEAITFTESGQELKEFMKESEPYLMAYNKEQFNRAASNTNATEGSQSSIAAGYMRYIEDGPVKYSIESIEQCGCGGSYRLHQNLATQVCSSCGRCVEFLDATASMLSYHEDSSYEISSFSYRRITHFDEWLVSIQAKETTHIPQAVLDSIMQRLVDERVTKSCDVTVQRVRDVLKRLKMRNFYEHTQLIICKLTGRVPPQLTNDQRELIRIKFLAASSAFERHKPADRSNFLSYAYVLVKLSSLCDLPPGITESFTFLKSREKLIAMDKIWSSICEDLDWPFEPSVV